MSTKVVIIIIIIIVFIINISEIIIHILVFILDHSAPGAALTSSRLSHGRGKYRAFTVVSGLSLDRKTFSRSD
jgi:hypothetical protein